MIISKSNDKQIIAHSHNDGTGTITFETRQDIEPILTQVKNLKERGSQNGEVRLAARIPDAVLLKYLQDNGMTMREFLNDNQKRKAFINAPENKCFRIWEGQV